MGKRIESPLFAVQLGRPKQPTPSRAKPRKPLPKKRKGPKRRKENGHVVGGHKLRQIVADEAYLEGLREDACEFTGLKAAPDDPVEAMHIGNPGKNLKSDDEALPARHSFHADTHRRGFVTVLREKAPDDLLLAMAKAYARERYRLEKGIGLMAREDGT